MVDIVTKLIEAVKNLFTFLTWTRLAMLTMLALLIAASTAFWENRPMIYGTITAGKFADGVLALLSPESQASIKNIVVRDPNIIAFQVIRTDFRNNTRDTVFFMSEVKKLAVEYELYLDNRIGHSSLFVKEDPTQNDRLISIIEQDFVCVPVPDNLLAVFPSAKDYSEQMCSISVPPRYGKMVGYINIWFSKPIGHGAEPYYRALARTIADEIYDRDVMKGTK